MRWYPPKNKTKRIRKGFLFLPKRIDYETRWLEYAVWEEVYYIGCYWAFWDAIRWVNEESND